MSLYGELKRRNVIRVAIAYLAGAWLLVELAGVAFPYFGIPAWSVRFLQIALALSFLPILALAWSFVMTPEGVIRDTPVNQSSAKPLDVFIIALVVAALSLFAAGHFWLEARSVEQETAPVRATVDTPQASAQYPANSIAVLPFVMLTRAGLVSYRREGTHIFYRRSNPLNDPGAADCGGVYQAILATLDETPLPEELRGRIAQVETERASRSREFFRANADKFREQQDLIAGHAQYGAVVEHLLETVSGVGNGSALEVGPGEGELLPAICRHFDRVTALDNSTEMLERSRQLARRQGLGKIDFCHGDTGTARAGGMTADVVTLNMVLHHTPAPATVIDDLARVLAPGGTLIITELCHHDQDWARSACGDLWLGFEPEELSQWARAAGLVDTSTEYLPLKNGFRVQIRQFNRPETH